MKNDVITMERFNAILDAVSRDGDGIGLGRDEAYYIVHKAESGVYKGEPYTKPARIQISDDKQRFWIERIGDELRTTYDPTGGFDQTPIEDQEGFRALARYVRKLEGHLHIVADIQRASAAAQPDLDVNDLRHFLELALPWCDEACRSQVEQRVRLAFESPSDYVREHRALLARRGIHHPVGHLGAIALVDALQSIGAAVEVDWNADRETLIGCVSELAANYGIDIPLKPGETESKTSKILERIGRYLAKRDHILTVLDIDADAYILLIISRSAYPQIKTRADAMGVALRPC